MTQSVNDGPVIIIEGTRGTAAGSDGQGGAPEDRDVAVVEAFRWVYRFFYSKTVGLVLILLMAFYAIIGSLIMQAPPGVDPASADMEMFLTQARETYGGWAPILEAAGFFHAYTSIGFYVVTLMLGLSIIACTVHRIPELWRRIKSPRVHVSKNFFTRARYRGQITTSVGEDRALDVTAAVLKKHRFRVIHDPRNPGRAMYADRNAWSGVGTVIAHLSFIMILLAFVITATWGFEQNLAVPVGGEVAVGDNSGLTVAATSFQDTYTEDGRPADYVAELVVSRDGQVLGEQEVRVNSPLDAGGYRFHQSSFGIAADVIVEGEGGEVIYAGSVPLKWMSNDNLNAVGKFELPASGPGAASDDPAFEMIVATAASGQTASTIPAGAALFELYPVDGNEQLGASLAPQGTPVEVGPYRVTFERERSYTGIVVRQDPGVPWMWVGSTLLVVGMYITFLFQYRRLWVRIDPEPEDATEPAGRQTGRSQILFGAVSRLDTTYQRQFERIIADVNKQLNEVPTSTEENTNG